MSFKTDKYVVIKEAISEDLAKFCYDYFMMIQNTVQNTQLLQAQLISTVTGAVGYEPFLKDIRLKYAKYLL